MVRNEISRRNLVHSAALIGLGAAAAFSKAASGQPTGTPQSPAPEPDYATETLTEFQRGDPALQPETITFDPYAIQGFSGTFRAQFRPRNTDFGSALLTAANKFIGFNRVNNQKQISDFLELFNLPFEMNHKPLAFCAAGLCHAAAMAYVEYWKIAIDPADPFSTVRSALPDLDHHHFYPSASVADIYWVARGKRRWVDRGKQLPKPGWLVVYDWKSQGGAEHIGIVESVDPKGALHTIEFNTSSGAPGDQSNGGHVAKRVRRLDKTVSGYVNTALITRV